MDSEGRELIDISAMIDDMWKGLKKYWWIFLIIISLSAVIFYLYARKSYTPYYTAYSVFTVNADVAVGFSEATYNQAMASQLGSIFPYLIESDVLRQMAAEDLGVEILPEAIQVSVMEGTNLITLRATSTDGQMSYDILQSAIRNYPRVGEYVMGDTSLNLMDESGVPLTPENLPDFQYQALKGGIYGGIFCVFLMALYAFMRKTIHKEEDLKNILNMKCLGIIPEARLKKRRSVKHGLVVLDNPGIPSMFAEAVRTMRTRIEREIREKGITSILVTSAVAGEGKSTIAANLALSLTKRGYSVLLVDGDFRKPAIAKTLGIKEGDVGFSDLLMGTAVFEETVIAYGDTNLKIIPGGKKIQSTAKLLNKPETKEMLEMLGQKAECVIFDSSPSAIVSDAAILAQYVEGILFVVRQDYAQTDKILEGVDMLASPGNSLCGCVLNAASSGITGSGYRYGRYGYGKYGG